MEATSHHADEEGESEIRAPTNQNFVDLDDIFDEMPVLAIDPDKVERIQSGGVKTFGNKELRLKRGIHTVSTGHLLITPQDGSGGGE